MLTGAVAEVYYTRKTVFLVGIKLLKITLTVLLGWNDIRFFFRLENDVFIVGVYIWVENFLVYDIVDVDFLN